MKKPKLLSPQEPCPGPSAVSGSDGTTLGASQGCAGWAGEGEGRKGARAPETTAPGVLQGLGQGAPSRGWGGATRTGWGLRKEVWGVLVSSWPTQWATRCSCQDTRASPIPPGCQGAASGPWPQAQAPGTPGKGLPESGGASSLRPPHPEHAHLPEPMPTPDTGGQQAGRRASCQPLNQPSHIRCSAGQAPLAIDGGGETQRQRDRRHGNTNARNMHAEHVRMNPSQGGRDIQRDRRKGMKNETGVLAQTHTGSQRVRHGHTKHTHTQKYTSTLKYAHTENQRDTHTHRNTRPH